MSSMNCAEASERLQAYFDGELDALGAAALERHIEGCPDCRLLLEDLGRMREALRASAPAERAPPALRARIIRALDAQGRRAPRWAMPPFWAGALGGFGSAALAGAAAFWLLIAPAGGGLMSALVDAHVRSLMPAHLIDVESSDRHTVKPWFAGHADVSPAVADFTPQGYRLIGGRADYLAQQRAAVVVYQHGAHLINVFSWAAERTRLPSEATRNGYRIECWKAGNVENCAVSDTGRDELHGLVRLLRELE